MVSGSLPFAAMIPDDLVPIPQETCMECRNLIAECLCKMDDMKIRVIHDMIKNDLAYFKNRLLRSPSESEICGIDNQTKPQICTIDEAPEFQISNR